MFTKVIPHQNSRCVNGSNELLLRTDYFPNYLFCRKQQQILFATQLGKSLVEGHLPSIIFPSIYQRCIDM